MAYEKLRVIFRDSVAKLLSRISGKDLQILRMLLFAVRIRRKGLLNLTCSRQANILEISLHITIIEKMFPTLLKLIQLLNMSAYPKGILCTLNKFSPVIVELRKGCRVELPLLKSIVERCFSHSIGCPNNLRLSKVNCHPGQIKMIDPEIFTRKSFTHVNPSRHILAAAIQNSELGTPPPSIMRI